jgi:hypothetical protein
MDITPALVVQVILIILGIAFMVRVLDWLYKIHYELHLLNWDTHQQIAAREKAELERGQAQRLEEAEKEKRRLEARAIEVERQNQVARLAATKSVAKATMPDPSKAAADEAWRRAQEEG